MATRRGLGKGIDSMIPDKSEKIISIKEEDMKDNVSRETLIDINKIEPNKLQPRKSFNEDAIHELSESIRQYGIIQPLLLQMRGDYYEIIAGERRWRAARIAGIKEVPAIIKEYSEQQIVEISLIENIQREDLNPIEEALAYQRLIEEFKLKQDELAERVSKSRTTITNSMRLLKLDERVQNMLIDDMISSGHARALISIEDTEMQLQIALKIFDEKLSVRETERLVKKEQGEKKEINKQEKDIISRDKIIYTRLEEKMKTIVGTKVSINNKANNKGKIEIEYYSNDELERIIELFEKIS